jgi:excisionase family DNA binding protein
MKVKHFIGINEVANLLGVKNGTVYQLIHKKKLTTYKPFGGKLLFKESEVLDLIERSKSN